MKVHSFDHSVATIQGYRSSFIRRSFVVHSSFVRRLLLVLCILSSSALRSEEESATKSSYLLFRSIDRGASVCTIDFSTNHICNYTRYAAVQFQSDTTKPKAARDSELVTNAWDRGDEAIDFDCSYEMDISTPLVKNVLLLDTEGKRLAVKYFSDDWPSFTNKLAFEKSVFTKTQRISARTEAEIGMFDGYVVVYKFISDVHFYVTGGEDENELILATVLQGFFDAVAILLRNNVEKKSVLANLDLVLLCLDEIVDGGIILETDGNVIAGRVAMRSANADVPFSEQTISQALATAKEHLARSLLK